MYPSMYGWAHRCFHSLAVINSGAYIIFELVFLFSLDIYLGVKLMVNVVALLLLFFSPIDVRN